MEKINLSQRVTAVVLILLLAVPFSTASLYGQETSTQTAAKTLFKTEELDQMLAPIALYPDALLAQVLTASTYPLEVVSATRLVKASPGLKSEELLALADDKDWDPSVKAMLGFPSVLEMMDEQLDWTTKLGDAFLAQQGDVMDSVQRLREKAYAQGSLTTTKEQVVKVQPQTQIIIVEPVSPQVIYVPVYNPLVVYGTWWYPAYPPYYYYPRRYLGRVFLTGFLVEVFWGGWGIWDCDWYHHNVYIYVQRHNDFTRRHYRRPQPYYITYSGGENHAWSHDPQHRRNAQYRDSSTAQRFGQQQRPTLRKTPSISGSKVGTGVRRDTRPATNYPKAGADNRAVPKPTKTDVIKTNSVRPTIVNPKPSVVNRSSVEVKQKNTQTIIKAADQKTVRQTDSKIIKINNIKKAVAESINSAVNRVREKSLTRDSKIGAGPMQSQGRPGGFSPGVGGLH